jgi:hypothetical protein
MANATLVPKRDAAQTLSPPLPACGEGIKGWGAVNVEIITCGEGVKGWGAVNVAIITN